MASGFGLFLAWPNSRAGPAGRLAFAERGDYRKRPPISSSC